MTDVQALHQYAQERDAEAFRVLVEQYQRLVYSAAARRLAHAHDIEDAVQITFLKLAKAAGTIRRDGGGLASWLYITALNAAGEIIRRDETRRRYETAGRQEAGGRSVPPPAFELEQQEFQKLTQLIDEAILKLDGDQQALIIEHFFQNRSQRDLAASLGTSQSTIARRIKEAIDALRQHLTGLGYTAAASAGFQAALQQLMAAPVPAALTVQLTKIGLAGTTSTAAKSAAGSAFVFSTGVKISLAVVGLILVLVAGLLIVPPPGSVPIPPVSPPASAPAVARAPATVAADAKPLDRLAVSYALPAGQNFRKIVPPFPAERGAYIDARYSWTGGADNVKNLDFLWKDGTLEDAGVSYVNATLQSRFEILGIEWFHFDRLETVPWNPGPSDWVVRDARSIEEGVNTFAAMISAEMEQPFRFQKKVVDRPCIVLAGDVHTAPEDVGGFQVVAVTLEPLLDEEFKRWLASSGNPTRTTYTAFTFQSAAQKLDAPFFSRSGQVDIRNAKFILTRDAFLHRADPDFGAKLQKILANIQSQIGGTWTIEDRDIDTWEPAEN